MRKLTLLAALLVTGISCISGLSQSAIRVMPLGDSITYGSGAPGGYRYPLYTALTNAGYNIDYVGTQTGNSVAGLGAEINHEGHGGWRASHATIGLYEHLYGWFDQIDDPHVVLIHVGTNDSNDPDFEHCIDEVDALVTRVAQCQPDAEIVVTTLMKRGAEDLSDSRYIAITNDFNPYVYPLVTNHQAQGHNVHYLDMHAYVELADMDDNLHPNATGYQKMADAWFPVVTNIIATNPAPNRPAAMYAEANDNHVNVTVHFNKAVSQASAENTANYSIDNGIAVTNASLSANGRLVTLTTTVQTPGMTHTITMNDIEDGSAPTPLVISSGSQVTFHPTTLRGYQNNVAESEDYQLIYEIDLPTIADYRDSEVSYSIDRSATIDDGNFSRVAYYLELQKDGEDLQYLWVSMDAFTNKTNKIGFPTVASGAVYQQYVQNLNVFCNVSGVTNGTGLSGNLEFWPFNYTAGNAASIPGASASSYDFGDTMLASGDHGSMQIHHLIAPASGETLMAINNWGGDGPLAIGIGTDPNTGRSRYNPDWTFADNSEGYTVRTLQVLVQYDDSSDRTGPNALSAKMASLAGVVMVHFDETVSAPSIVAANFTIDNGVVVTSAERLSDGRTVRLTTTALPERALVLTINGVRDAAANLIAPDTTLPLGSGIPDEIITNVGISTGELAHGYELVYSLDIPSISQFGDDIEHYDFNLSDLELPFDRIAYYLELTPANNASTQYVWTSMDAFTDDLDAIGVPTFASGSVFQHSVSNLDVKSSVAGVTNGTGMAGNIEFWPHNYSAPNAIGIPGASDSTYDFGDTRSTAGAHGSMQIHNSEWAQSVLCMNNWGASGRSIAIGIGNQPTSHPDWTLADNAHTYVRRRMHILVRPAAPPPLPPEVSANVTGAEGYHLAYTINIPVQADFWNNADSYYLANNYTNGLPQEFTRVAYYLELVAGTATSFVWTAMDAFTGDASRIDVPRSGTHFRQYVSNLEIQSNVGGVTTGTVAAGNIEFWPSSYDAGNDAGVPGASETAYDFGDGNSGTSKGYGSMQVHNYTAGQTLFAVNHFNDTSETVDIGIGNRPHTDTDWTFAGNAADYDSRRMHIFILPGGDGDNSAPALNSATASRSLDRVIVTFNEEMSDNAADPSKYSIDNGVTVVRASLRPDRKNVILTTTAMVAGQPYTLSASGIRDRSVNANLLPPHTTVDFTAPVTTALPGFFSDIPEFGEYNLIHELAVADSTTYANGCDYSVDESVFPRDAPFDRIAYCMELETGGTGTWAWASMDAFTTNLRKIGVPTADRQTAWQIVVDNMNVYASSNAAVTTGMSIATGNLEFWPSNYGAQNSATIPGADAGTYDFGDGGYNSTSAGHGSMQVHNFGEGHTIMSMISFGSNNRTPGLGIGNNPVWTNNDPDWTFTYNAATYTTKNIYVFIHDGVPTPSGTPPRIWIQPTALTVYTGESAVLHVYSPDASSYQWRKNGVWLPAENAPWLELSPVGVTDGATYDVVVSAADGSFVVSQSARLHVIPVGTLLIAR
ncbi:MAG: hypothetical protein HN341_15495 [Verrucomicrobia bacterium]|nr:hypothetical protein [Verrucomicrobiota bacterium]